MTFEYHLLNKTICSGSGKKKDRKLSLNFGPGQEHNARKKEISSKTVHF